MAGAGRMYEVRARTSFTSALALARVFASGSDGSNLLRSQLVMLKCKKKYCLPLRQYTRCSTRSMGSTVG